MSNIRLRLRKDHEIFSSPGLRRPIQMTKFNRHWGKPWHKSRRMKQLCNRRSLNWRKVKTQVITMEGALKQAETNLKYTTIVSPIDGTVVARNIDVGQSVAATLQAPNVFTVAQDLKRMQVYAATDESDTGSITVGTPVTFQVDAYPTEQFHGRVSAVRLNATTVQNVVTYNTVIDFENPTEKLLPGETAYVTIPTGHVKNTIEIPNGALTFSPELSRAQLQALYQKYNISHAAAVTHLGGWQVVWKSAPANQTVPVPVAVQCGITDFTSTQLIQGGSARRRCADHRISDGGGRRRASSRLRIIMTFREVIRVALRALAHATKCVLF